jgi:hypothetical protein
MPRLRRLSLALGLLAILVNSACYAYQPSTGVPNPGAEVRFQLTDAGSAELARYLGPNVREVTGRLVDVLPSGLLVVAPEWISTSSGLRQPWSGEGTVGFSRDQVSSLDQRTFNRRLTMITSVAVTASLIAIAAIALKSGGAHGRPGPDGSAPAR